MFDQVLSIYQSIFLYFDLFFRSFLEGDTQFGAESMITNTKPNLPTPKPSHSCTSVVTILQLNAVLEPDLEGIQCL